MKIVDLRGSVAVGLMAAMVLTGSAPAWAYESGPREIIQQGLLGAGVGALSAEGSGGKAGTGALIGAGTQIVGGALMTLLTEPSSPAATYGAPVSYRAPSYRTAQPASKKIVRHYDTAGNLVSEEEFWA